MTSDIERNEGEKHFFERLKKENKLHQEFCTFLSRNMRNSFRNNLYDAVDSSNGSVNNDVVISRLTDVVRKSFFMIRTLMIFLPEKMEKNFVIPLKRTL